MVNAQLVTHGVGQGLFYSGSVMPLHHEGEVNFVYDCGVRDDGKGHPTLASTISTYKGTLPPRGSGGKKQLDLLFISHLHDDHTAGLPELLKDVETRYLFLPYLAEWERALVFMQSSGGEAWFPSFLADPVLFATTELGVRYVVLLTGAEPKGGRPGREDNPDRPPQEDLEGSLDRAVSMLEDDPNRDRTLAGERGLPRWQSLKLDQRVLLKTDSRPLRLPYWRFKFFSAPPNQGALAQFRNDVNALLRGRSLADLLTSPAGIKGLEAAYEKLSDSSRELHWKVNNTSLVTYHGPNNQALGDAHTSCSGPNCCKFVSGPCLGGSFGEPFGTLLTGDLHFLYSDLYLQQMTHFASEQRLISTLLMPHHGARSSWNPRLLQDLPNLKQVIASASVHSRYGHPSAGPIQDVIQAGRDYYWSRQQHDVRVDMHLRV
ncbi:MAG: hypothetical protein KGJ23_13955 [Euryarchaeota archaeon]|nr:hypothetical protein [Euryarchaeota archaeon]MDE1837702.1 hypothetical protein [Euryarchaeota archaeon]MDE1881739.1 hypothetical protein [Euryarchaeota archaeon]MDE2045968.1 hypothetical protein [Thermoplasmata archaeon]